MRAPTLIVATGAVLLIAAVLVGEPFAASPRERLKAKAARAQQVLQQVDALDLQFGRTVEAWHGAQYELDQARQQLAVNRAMLRVAERQQRIAIARVNARLVGLYESSDEPTMIGIFLGSSTISEMINRLDAAETVSAADHTLAVEAGAARNRYARRQLRIRMIESIRAVAVGQLVSQRGQIGAMLAQRRQLLSSIQSQIATLRAQEARRQAILAAQARVRLAREQALLEQQATKQAHAAAAARSAATSAPAVQPPLATTTLPSTPTPAPTETPTTPTSTATTTAGPPASSMPAPAASAGSGHPEAATIAMRYLGVPYAWGGSTPGGFDCSGLVMYVYGQLGISLPHFAAAQYGFGTPVSRIELQPGDLVFFDGLNHVGIYIGGGEMVHAPQAGDVVKISPLTDFGAGYVGARRL